LQVKRPVDGYVAFAPDLFGAKFQGRKHGVTVIKNLVQQPSVLRQRLSAAARVLERRTDVAVIDFCFGRLLELARSGTNLACAASFHGSLKAIEPAQPGRVKCKLLVCTPGRRSVRIPR
jgi:dienelactone hydrolase